MFLLVDRVRNAKFDPPEHGLDAVRRHTTKLGCGLFSCLRHNIYITGNTASEQIESIIRQFGHRSAKSYPWIAYLLRTAIAIAILPPPSFLPNSISSLLILVAALATTTTIVKGQKVAYELTCKNLLHSGLKMTDR